MIQDELVRIAACSPELRVADIRFNTEKIVTSMREAASAGSVLALFPELSLTGYTCGDLLTHRILLDGSRAALTEIAEAGRQYGIAAVVGLPLAVRGHLYNCAAIIANGEVAGFVPKIHLPTRREYYESRWFTSGSGLDESVRLGGRDVPIGASMVFDAWDGAVRLGVEICEDLWSVTPPSGFLCLAGANLILNLSASNEVVGKASYRRSLVQQQSSRGLCAYIYASSGPHESSTDLVFSGHCIAAENGLLLSESSRYQFTTQISYADVDFGRIEHERRTNSSFAAIDNIRQFRRVDLSLSRSETVGAPLGTYRHNSPTPFLPQHAADVKEVCQEIITIQATGLAKRLKHTQSSKVVLGVSGGMDSSLALLVCASAFDKLGLAREGITAVCMPGFGTTNRTASNAQTLIRCLGASMRIIPIEDAVRKHFADIGHDGETPDITFENSQARERTQLLMDIANMIGGFVVGTGDLSEMALGWCTFNGDQMSMYGLNAGVPKTLVRALVEEFGAAANDDTLRLVLKDICDTPVSPELLPVSAEGKQQETESTIGPYVLHDYFLYHFVRSGYAPKKILYFAKLAHSGTWTEREIRHWLKIFFIRFFGQQYKRSSMPDGPKIGSVGLSPRGDWRMPSDASNATWLDELN